MESTIPDAEARRAALLEAQAATATAAQPAAELLAAHCWRAIEAWARGGSAADRVRVPAVGIVAEDTLAQWEKALAAKGYVTAREGHVLVVRLP